MCVCVNAAECVGGGSREEGCCNAAASPVPPPGLIPCHPTSLLPSSSPQCETLCSADFLHRESTCAAFKRESSFHLIQYAANPTLALCRCPSVCRTGEAKLKTFPFFFLFFFAVAPYDITRGTVPQLSFQSLTKFRSV